jgi:hypothetical protein
VSRKSNPQPGRPGSYIYVPQSQDGPVTLSGTRFPFRRLLRLAGLWWWYSKPPPQWDTPSSTLPLRLILMIFPSKSKFPKPRSAVCLKFCMHFLSLSWVLHDSPFQIRPTTPVPIRNKHKFRRRTFSYPTNPPDEERPFSAVCATYSKCSQLPSMPGDCRLVA